MAKHNPFSIFRRNQRAWMAGLTLFTMFSFIALGSMLQCVGTRNQGTGPHYVGDVAKTLTFGSLSYNDFLEYRAEAMRLQGFLENLIGVASELNGAPSTDLIFLRLQLAVCTSNSELLVDRWLIEQYARREKLVASDAAVMEYLTRLTRLEVYPQTDSNDPNAQRPTAASYPSDALKRCLRAAGLTESQLNEILKGQIAIDRFVRKVDAGMRLAPMENPYLNRGTVAQLAFGHGALPTAPEDKLLAYEAMNCALKLKLASFNAGDFVGQVNEPSEAQAKAFYEQYKNIEYHPDSETPGFTQPTKLAMELARVEINDETLDAISMEDVQKYYDEHKEEFRMPKPSTPAEPLPQADAIGLGDDAPSITATPDDILNNLTLPQEDAPTVDVAAPETPANEAPATQDAPAETPNNENAPTEQPAENEGAMTLRQATLLASYQQEAEPVAEAPAEAPATQDAPAEAPAETPAAQDAPAEAPAEEPATQDAPAEAPAEEPATQDAPAEVPAEAPATQDAPAEAPAEAPATQDATAEAPAEAPATNADPDYMPLDMVESVIRRRIACERIEAKMAEARAALQTDFLNSQKADDAYATDFDLKKFAEDNGMQYLVTTTKANKDATKPGLITRDDAVVMDVLPSEELNQIFSSAPLKFSPRRVGLYNPEENPSVAYNPPTVFYVYRVVDSKSQTLPEFDEIKDEVALAWKLREAKNLAYQAANEFKEKVEGGADFDATAKEMRGNVVETEKFSWFSSSFGSYYASPSEIREVGVEVEQAARDNKEIVAPGWDFYETAYALDKDALGVVANQPKDRVFVMKVIEKDEIDPAAYEKIDGEMGLENVLMQINNAKIEKFHNDWIKKLREKANFEWVNIPKLESNR